MQSRYKLIISNKTLYKEVEIAPNIDRLVIGTGMECDVRLRNDMFFSSFEISCVKENNQWSMFCSDNIYISVGDIRKLLTKQLEHGDVLIVKYQESDNELFELSFLIDFDYEKKDYNRKIYLPDNAELKVGGENNADIYLQDDYLGTDGFVLFVRNHKIQIRDINIKYGIYINGKRIESAEIKDKDFLSVVGFSFYYMEGALYTSSTDKIVVKNLRQEIINNQSTCFDYPKFNRNTRIQYQLPDTEIEIKQPSNKPTKQKKNIVLSLIPSLVMLAMTIVLRGIIGGGGTFVIYSAVSMSLGIIMSVVTYFQDSKIYVKECRDREESYNKYIDEKIQEIEVVRDDELRIRNLIYESIENSVEEVNCFGKRIFERRLDDKDFLQVYLGRGRIESSNQIKFTKQDFVDADDSLVTLPEEISLKYKFIDDAPVCTDLYNSNAVGVVGNKNVLNEILKNMSLDISVRHFYGDVKLVYLLNNTLIEQFAWVRWLKNVNNEQLDIKNIVCDEESKNSILEYLYLELSNREQNASTMNATTYTTHYIVFVRDVKQISCHPVTKYVDKCNRYGFTFVFFDEYEENIPLGCNEIIRLSDKNTILNTENGDLSTSFKYPILSDGDAEKIALKLSSIYVDEINLEGQLTKNITLFDLLGIMTTEDLDLQERWNNSKVYKSLAAPLGVKRKNQVVSLDISDKAGAHGPHGLVAGTTGSGKSEILQSYILSMATLFHPYEVGFVIIDFKGGGMSNQFTDLPHLIGTITNIDGREINRSLLSIKSELVKRQELFSQSGVNHINEYIKLYKAGKVNNPLPHLIMVVDEFAELKAEYPDFMKELISAARIGRTLGVHLILATQKPSGVVDAQIWSNSKFKLCLKVQTKEDSNEVIKTPLAAEIVEPGRAYFQVGNNEIFELFQSAYSGAGVPVANSSVNGSFSVYEKNIWGKKTLVYTNKKKKITQETETQLQAIVNYVSDYCKLQGIQKLPGICLPSLEDRISTDKLDYSIQSNVSIEVPVGIYDDPEQQMQGNVVLDLSRENVYIVGSAQMGKTVLLQTIAYGLINKYTPEQVNIYMVDCGSMVLKIFEQSAHIGGVVLSTQDEKCKNLFKLLNAIVVERKRILSDKGIGNYASYLDAGYTDLPMVVVMIDNMAAFKEYFQEQADELSTLSREAQGVGISFVITAATANALNYRVQANFAKKYVLNCNDSGEYSNVFGHCKATPKEVQGRGLMLLDRRIVEWQVAIFGKSEKESERSELLKAFILEKNSLVKCYARKIPMVPDKLELVSAEQENLELFRKNHIIPIGMSYSDVEYITVDLVKEASLSLVGNTDNMSAFLKNFMSILGRNIVFHNTQAWVIDNKLKKLSEMSSLGFVREYANEISDAMRILDDFYSEVEQREDEPEADDTIVLLIINNIEFMRHIYSDKNLSKEFSNVLKKIAEQRAFVLISEVENQPVGFNASEVLKTIKEERSAVLFAPIHENKMFELTGRVKPDRNFEKTNAYYLKDGNYCKIRIFE